MAIEKEDIVQYVQETPGNSNPAVLRSLLNQLEGSGEGATFKVEKEDDEKSYQSAYTGAEIDAAVAKAGNVPDVSEADAGKALVVDSEGKIVPGEAGGGVLNVLFGAGENDTIICNHTFSEIYNALEDKQPVIFAEEVEAGKGSGYISTCIEYSASKIIATFYSFSFGSGDATLVITKYIIASDNTITVDYADRGVSTL